MGAYGSWNVEINISVYENEMFSLPAEFHFNNINNNNNNNKNNNHNHSHNHNKQIPAIVEN